jgi:hypothetical protein
MLELAMATLGSHEIPTFGLNKLDDIADLRHLAILQEYAVSGRGEECTAASLTPNGL